jgi:hypothetical protein
VTNVFSPPITLLLHGSLRPSQKMEFEFDDGVWDGFMSQPEALCASSSLAPFPSVAEMNDAHESTGLDIMLDTSYSTSTSAPDASPAAPKRRRPRRRVLVPPKFRGFNLMNPRRKKYRKVNLTSDGTSRATTSTAIFQQTGPSVAPVAVTPPPGLVTLRENSATVATLVFGDLQTPLSIAPPPAARQLPPPSRAGYYGVGPTGLLWMFAPWVPLREDNFFRHYPTARRGLHKIDIGADSRRQ